ncbi:MAG: hypothetical protein GY798_16155 [Hyphomicrobiales bacterium]|nr:hypothetical protein [Hyphomicrobiales bacterium]
MSENAGNILKYRIRESGHLLAFADVLDLWERDPTFADFFISLFRRTGRERCVWETPALSNRSLAQEFECVIHDAPGYVGQPDRRTFADYFDADNAPDGIVAFENIGGDAFLIVPSPYRADADYSGLADFFREAPISQQRGLWREVGRHAKRRLSGRPLWVSVAGGGVQWLHIRLDSFPKYYRYRPYTKSG